MAGVFTNIVSLLSLWKRAALQVIQPLRPLLAPPGSCSLTKSNRCLGVAPKKGQANYTRAFPAPTKELSEELNKVNFLEDKDIGINKDNNYNSPTLVPLSKEGFILTSSLPKDYPSVNYEGVSLL